MEKHLIEKWQNGTMDEVDKEMFKARLKVVQDKVCNAMSILHDVVDNNEDELAIMGVKMIIYVDSTYPKSAVGGCKVLAGPKPDLCEWADHIKDVCKE